MIRLLFIGIAFLCVFGCTDKDTADLEGFTKKIYQRPVGAIEPIPKYQPHEYFTYTASNLRSPFQPPIKIDAEIHALKTEGIRPDETRIKQFLENFNIEIFDMVGIISNSQEVNGLLRAAGSIYRVKVGDYLGKNHGKIVAIKNTEIHIVEIIPDGEGGWLERPKIILID